MPDIAPLADRELADASLVDTKLAEPELGPPSRQNRFAGIASALGLLAVGVWMLSTFLPALAWAVILAIATWPLYVAARYRIGRTLAAVAATALIAAAVLAPLAFAVVEVAREARGAIQWVIDTRNSGFELPQWIANLPVVGAPINDWVNSHLASEQLLTGGEVRSLTEWGRVIGLQAARRTTTLLFALLIVFFVFRNSETLLQQSRAVGRRLLGPSGPALGQVAAVAVRGTVDGLLLVGLGEAILLGIAYAVCGVPHPALFGLMTGILSAIPFASPLVFIAAGLWLFWNSAVAAAIALVAFGTVVFFIADHFVRPALIGGSTRLPFIWVLLGILGGIESFGLLGLFLGPALLAVLITLWRELAAAPPIVAD